MLEQDRYIESMMRGLKLGGMAKNWKTVEYTDKSQYMADVLRLEIQEREVNRINRLTKKAGFRVLKTLDEFVPTSNIELPPSLTWEYMTDLKFIPAKENLIFAGGVGTGKTHLATALGVKACQEGHEVRFSTAASLANTLMEKNSAGKLSSFINGFKSAELVILDEVGFVPLHREAAELLFQLISTCYEVRSVIITSNLEFANWNSVFTDERLAAALIDRLVHHSHIAVFRGASYRLSQSIRCQKTSVQGPLSVTVPRPDGGGPCGVEQMAAK